MQIAQDREHFLRGLRELYRPKAVVGLRILGVPITLVTNDARVSTSMESAFSPFVVGLPEPHSKRLYLLHNRGSLRTRNGEDVAIRAEGQLESQEQQARSLGMMVRRLGNISVLHDAEDWYILGDVISSMGMVIDLLNSVVATSILQRHADDETLEGGDCSAAQLIAG